MPKILETLFSDKAERPVSGNLGALIEDGKFYVHPDLESFMKDIFPTKIPNPLEVYSVFEISPSALVYGLNWTVLEVAEARRKLEDQLREYYPNVGKPSPVRKYGAFP